MDDWGSGVVTFLSNDDNWSSCAASRASAVAISSSSLASTLCLLAVSRMGSSIRETLISLLDTPPTGVNRCRLEDSESSSSSYKT